MQMLNLHWSPYHILDWLGEFFAQALQLSTDEQCSRSNAQVMVNEQAVEQRAVHKSRFGVSK